MHCDQCEMLSINGVACHESGCPNSDARWDEFNGWVKQRKCFRCGCTVDQDDLCCDAPQVDPDTYFVKGGWLNGVVGEQAATIGFGLQQKDGWYYLSAGAEDGIGPFETRDKAIAAFVELDE